MSINKVLSEIEMKNTKIQIENKNNKETTNKYNPKIENNNNNGLNCNNQKIDKNLFKEEELADVDCIDNLNSLKVLKDRLKKL